MFYLVLQVCKVQFALVESVRRMQNGRFLSHVIASDVHLQDNFEQRLNQGLLERDRSNTSSLLPFLVLIRL